MKLHRMISLATGSSQSAVAAGEDSLTFKKDGADPEFNRMPFIGFQWVGAVAAALGLIPSPDEVARREYNGHRRGKRPQQKREKRRNMVTHSKRVRRRHRRAA